MITGFFLSLFYTLIAFIVGLLPTTAYPSGISDGIELFWGYIQLFSLLIPVTTLLTIVGLSLSYYAALLLWDAMHWLMRRIRN